MDVSLDRRTVAGGVAASLVFLGGAGAQPRPAAPSGGEPAAERPAPTVLRAVARGAKLIPDAGDSADLWQFEGETAHPVLRVPLGGEVHAVLENATPAPLSLHWHGVRGPNGQDGVGGLTQAPVPPGGSHTYRFTPPDPGTFLIRPLVLGGSSAPAGRGLAALLVVEEPSPPAVDADLAVLVRDWLLAPGGALAPFGLREEAALGGRLGNRVAVDGGDAPKRVALPSGSRVRLRLANACNARSMRIRFDGLKVYVAAVDGQPTDTFEPLRATLPFAPGSRYDLLFDVPAEPDGKGAVVALIGPGMPLVEVTASSGPAAPSRPPIAALPPNRLLPPEVKLQNALRRTVAIAGGATRSSTGALAFPPGGAPIWTVNGAPGSAASPPLLSARRGQPVVLGITNATAFVQALHLHGHVFRLLHPLDDGWEPYWLDTVQVPEGRTVQIAFLADNPGRWLLGSTVLERLDAGLWTWLEVT